MFLKKNGGDKPENFKKQNIAALVFAAVAAVCLLTGYLQTPALYPADYGQYDQYMRQCGLTWTQADLEQGDLYYTRSLQYYDYAHTSWMKLLSPSAGYSTVYAVALVRLFTAPFGLPFSGGLLALVWGAVLCFSVYRITLALIQLLRHGWWIAPAVLCLLFTDGNVIAMLRGLYPQGGMLCCGLLYAGELLHAEQRRRGGQKQRLAGLALATVLFIKSGAPMLLFLPFAALIFLYYLSVQLRRSAKNRLCWITSLVIITAGLAGAVELAVTDHDYFSDAAVYQSTFNVMLPASDQPGELLRELGLDSSYLADVGRSYYDDASVFAHPPTDEQEAEALFSVLSAGKTAAVYARHPQLLLQVIRSIPAPLNGYTNIRNLSIESQDGYRVTRTGDGPLAFVRLTLPYSWAVFAVCCGALILVLAVCAVKKRRALPGILILAALGAALYLPACVIMSGYGIASQYALFQVLLMDGMLVLLLTGAYCCSFPVSAWLTRFAESPFPARSLHPDVGEFPAKQGGSLRLRLIPALWKKMSGSRKWTVLCVTAVAAAMILITLLKPARAGCVNNGDFGRMMGSIDLIWSGDVYYDTDAQSLHWVIEDYEWTQPFNWKKLTPLEPAYGLYGFAAISRLFTDAVGRPMNTYVLQWVMALFTLGCITLLTCDLYKVLNKWTLPFGLFLCMVFCSETSLTWYNGLFGEGALMLGLLLSIACAVHLAVLPKRMNWLQWGWFPALGYSLYIMTSSKAQMLLSVPFSIVLLCALVWYHRPYRYDLQALAAGFLAFSVLFISVGTYRVYTAERNSSSGAQMHTMWQAYFYGIFMISDDPIADMEELGIDTRMAADIGKYVDFSPDAEYVYFPLSDEAKEAFTDHVSTFKIILWYLKHPAKLIYMFNHAAEVSRELYTGFRVYKGQDYWDWANRDTVDGLGLWQYWRQVAAPHTFWGYAIFYGAFLWAILRGIFKKTNGENGTIKMLCWVLLFIMMTGVLQYPLSVLGNGFADNQKQLFCFSLCYDLLLGVTLLLGLRFLLRPHKIVQERIGKLKERINKRSFARSWGRKC